MLRREVTMPPPELTLPAPLDRPESAVRRGAEEYAQASQRNVERYVGTARVPLGLAGPLRIRGERVDGEVHVPLATTEGALVASTARGMKVLNACGGVQTRLTRAASIQRAPVFEFEGLEEAVRFARGLEADWRWLEPVVASKTRHGRLRALQCFVQGRLVHVRFDLDPAEAAGQNMVSIAAAACVAAILQRTPGVRHAWMEGGLSGEKVPAALNRLLGRGRGAAASATLPGETLRQITRAEPADLVRLFSIYVNASSWAGNANTHASLINVLPAIFIATGQDVACLAECSVAQNAMDYDARADTLRWEVVCPNLVVGSVGGGTHLPTQRECLEVLGCTGEGGADRLAEICAATALANEISFWSAIVANEWVRAHERRRGP
jgi:hydroxymethylglutaryl-CoA reductase (NADPH)